MAHSGGDSQGTFHQAPNRKKYCNSILAPKELGLYYLQSRYYDPELCRFLNADIFVSTGQGELGNNMFAYCGNNPANCIDINGQNYLYLDQYIISLLCGAVSNLVVSISSAMASIKAAIATAWLPVVCIAAASVGISALTYAVYKVRCLQISSQKAVIAVQKQILAQKYSQSELKGYTVYAIARTGTTDVVYVGITKNYSSRQYTHQRKPGARFPESKYDMVPIATGLNHSQARALEQTLICAYGIETLVNMINSISPSKWGYFVQEFNQMATLLESYFAAE